MLVRVLFVLQQLRTLHSLRPEALPASVSIGARGHLFRHNISTAYVSDHRASDGIVPVSIHPPRTVNAIKKKLETREDFKALFSSILNAAMMLLVTLGIFSALRPNFPQIYASNAKPGGDFALEAHESFATAARRITTEEGAEAVGLDSALLLEFDDFATNLIALIGVPLLLTCPLNYIFGPPTIHILNRMSVAHVELGHPVLWVHCVLVWIVLFVAQRSIINAQARFLELRSNWLQTMKAPRSTSILVEGIPKGQRTDSQLREYFQELFGDHSVEEASVVLDTKDLKNLSYHFQVLENSYKDALCLWEDSGRDPEKRPRSIPPDQKDEVDTMTHCKKNMKRIASEVEVEQRRLLDAALEGDDTVCTQAGFVTFMGRETASIAALVNFKVDPKEMSTSIPPAPSDVIYEDLKYEGHSMPTILARMLGAVLLLGLFFGFLPVISLVSTMSHLDYLSKHITLVAVICEHYPGVQAAVEGILTPAILTIFNAFIPTVLMIVFDMCYALKAKSWSQMDLQVWYYWFLLIFTVLATAIGTSLIQTASKLIQHPLSVFELLAKTLPSAATFFLNFIILQIAALGIPLIRMVPLAKFLFYRRWRSEAEAKALSEPEDQDFDGMGGRAARLMSLLAIVIIYGTLNPLLCIAGYVFFWATRRTKGYLILFAETKKPDSGGFFWVQMLESTFQLLFIYLFVMIGVLHFRGGCLLRDSFHWVPWLPLSMTPGLCCVPAFLALEMKYLQFRSLKWQQLPYETIGHDFQKACNLGTESGSLQKAFWTRRNSQMQALSTYKQPELQAVHCELLKKSIEALQAQEMTAYARQTPRLGILRCDYQYLTAASDVEHPGSFGYAVCSRAVPGMTWDVLTSSDPLSSDVQSSLEDALGWLESLGVVGVVADCGMMANFRKAARDATSVHMFTSSLMQCPLVCSAFTEDEPILIITAWESGSVQRDTMLTKTGLVVDQTRCLVAQVSHLSGFEHVPVGGTFEYQKIAPGLVELGKEWLTKYPKIRAIILECTETVPYADLLRFELGIPVFDAITLCDLYRSALKPRPRPDGEADRTILGLIQLDGASSDSFHVRPECEVKCRAVPGLTQTMCESGEMTPEVRKNFEESLAWLEGNGVAAVTGCCTCSLRFQAQARRSTKVPVFMSPLMALPVLQGLYESSEKVLVLTADAAKFDLVRDALLGELGTAAEQRLVIAGVDALPGGDKLEAGLPVNSDEFEQALLSLARGLLKDNVEIRAVLIEAMALATHADVLRSTLGLPVFDAFTICDFFHSACKDNPRFGIGDWRFTS